MVATSLAAGGAAGGAAAEVAAEAIRVSTDIVLFGRDVQASFASQ